VPLALLSTGGTGGGKGGAFVAERKAKVGAAVESFNHSGCDCRALMGEHQLLPCPRDAARGHSNGTVIAPRRRRQGGHADLQVEDRRALLVHDQLQEVFHFRSSCYLDFIGHGGLGVVFFFFKRPDRQRFTVHNLLDLWVFEAGQGLYGRHFPAMVRMPSRTGPGVRQRAGGSYIVR